MRTVRVWSIITLVLLAAFHIVRILGPRCSGNQCDTSLLPLSTLLDVLILVVAAVTGFLAISAARQAAQVTWAAVLGACTLLGVLGPIVGLAVIRNSADAFVLTATLLVLLVPLTALAYSFLANGPARHRPA
jgi:hypothetical protein